MLIPTINRDQLASIYGVSQGYLGHLLREKRVPLPIQVGGEILWFNDEVQATVPNIKRFTTLRPTHRPPRPKDVSQVN